MRGRRRPALKQLIRERVLTPEDALDLVLEDYAMPYGDGAA